MEKDSVAAYWLVIATSISALTSTALYILGRCCAGFCSNVSSVCFQAFAKRLDIREETFYQVTNLLVIPRLLSNLQMQSYRVVWTHDANAQTGDYVQWGWMRIPSKSWVLSLLSTYGITHYVHIQHDLKTVTIVGPRSAVAALINMSNAASTTSITRSQLNELREAFGLAETHSTQADKICIRWERRVSCCICLCIVDMWLIFGQTQLWLQVFAGSMPILIGLGAVFQRTWQTCEWRRGQAAQGNDRNLQLPLITTAEEIEAGFHSGEAGAFADSRDGQVCEDLYAFGQGVTCHTPHVDEEHQRYSVLIARVYYYEIVAQTPIKAAAAEKILEFGDSARLYTMSVHPNFVRFVAERTKIHRGEALHICVHNPMTEPSLLELYQNVQKGVDLQILLMVILPPLSSFDACFENTCMPRSRTAKCTQFITTLADLQTLLLQLTAGFLPKLVFVIPIESSSPEYTAQTLRTSSKVVEAMSNILGSDHYRHLDVCRSS